MFSSPRALAVVMAAVAALALTMQCAASSGPASTSNARLQQDVDGLVQGGAPGAILLVRDGATSTRYTAGVSNLETQAPIAAADHYRIASLTKTYVATVMLQLVAERKVRLTDTVEKWLPGVVPNGAHITVRMLLIHTSGLHDHEIDPDVLAPYLGGDLSYYWSPLRLVEIATSRPPQFAPGQTTVSSYSSTNYLIAGLIIERATGRSLGAELNRRIFRPLHLDATSFPTRQTQLPEPYAHGYFVLGQPPLTDLSALSPSLSGPAGAIVSTVGDVADFYRALLSGKLVKRGLLAEMRKTMPEAHGDLGQRMGLGLERFPTSCGAAWGHSGSFPGYWTHAWSSANGTHQTVLMVNIDPSAVSDATRAGFYETLYDAYCSRTT
jgi:D-alanyl-D-alanine carboxypeptidase